MLVARGFRGVAAIFGAIAVLACTVFDPDESSPSSEGGAASAAGVATLALVGDTMFDGEIAAASTTEELSYPAFFDPIRWHVEDAGLAVFNLETTIGASGTPLEKEFTFTSEVAALEALAGVGFDVAIVANNHVLDYGEGGLERTLGHLEANGLRAVGLHADPEPQVPVVVEVDGVRIGLLAYADGAEGYAYADEFRSFAIRPAEATEEAITRDLATVAPLVDAIVVSMHWGIENRVSVTERQRELGRFLVDRGVDVVMGHHPHVQQAAEWYSDGLVIHSLGNFVFGLSSMPAHRESRLYRVRIDARGSVDADYLELQANENTWAPTPVTGDFVRVERNSLP